ncbi:unnamed protein product [Caenorhabditis angaria]|uniref:glutathione transferase n=1 Tax=Caenorhabditis angaria TaxID=860376 RepID=A0A9P1I9J6_9PELO|nr:unnamed protein product [Caenorhabditis angaria]
MEKIFHKPRMLKIKRRSCLNLQKIWMVNYKLTYFDTRGLAEASRQVFHLAGVKFEDVRIPFGDPSWEKLKKKTPFGQIPVLSVDGFEIPQSMAILRYLSRKFGFAGKTPEEEAWVDAIVDQFKDYIVSFRQLIVAVREKKSVDEIEKIRKEISDPAKESYFKILNGILTKSKSGFLVGDSVTFADLVVADNLVTLEKNGEFNRSEQPKLTALLEKVHNLPKLKKYIGSRPDTQF